MEAWHLPYESIMAMPFSRRSRLFERKLDLERERSRKK